MTTGVCLSAMIGPLPCASFIVMMMRINNSLSDDDIESGDRSESDDSRKAVKINMRDYASAEAMR